MQAVLKTDTETAHHSFCAGEIFTVINQWQDYYGNWLVSLKDNYRTLICAKNNIEIINK